MYTQMKAKSCKNDTAIQPQQRGYGHLTNENPTYGQDPDRTAPIGFNL